METNLIKFILQELQQLQADNIGKVDMEIGTSRNNHGVCDIEVTLWAADASETTYEISGRQETLEAIEICERIVTEAANIRDKQGYE